MRRTTTQAVAAGTALLLTGLLGYAWADAADVAPGVLTAMPQPSLAPLPEPTVEAPELPAPAPAVLEGVAGAPDVDASQLAGVIDPLLADPSFGPLVSVSVRDLATGQEVYGRDAQRPQTPASIAKVLTAIAALDVLGADTTVETVTRWVPAADRGSAGRPAVVLVGGGDVLLAAGAGDLGAVDGRAGLADLAAATADRLVSAGGGSDGVPGLAGALLPGEAGPQLDVVVDDSLLGAPQPLPQQPKDVTFAAEPASLAIGAGIVEGRTARDRDPASRAGSVFAAALEEALAARLGPVSGQGVSGQGYVGDVSVSTNPVAGDQLAAVESARIAEVVEYVLWTSDNTVANALAGLVAAASGQPTDLVTASATVVERVAGVVGATDGGAALGPTRLADGSGLFDGSVTTAAAMSRALAAAATSDDADVRAVTELLPVAGAEGTVAERYGQDSGAGGASGLARAKTGTLSGVTTLAGVVTVSGGRGLAFAVLTEGVAEDGTLEARAAVDRVVAAIAGCEC